MTKVMSFTEACINTNGRGLAVLRTARAIHIVSSSALGMWDVCKLGASGEEAGSPA